HCKGGLGRAGTVAARLLTELGHPAEDAIVRVRTERPGALETRAQEYHVRASRPVIKPAPDTLPDALEDRAIGALLGLAAGDAVGTTLEFRPRDSEPLLTDMVGGGPFGLRAGQWTDDTAMALALADSLLTNPELDEQDLMVRFWDWWTDGRYACTGTCFDIGATVSAALQRWRRTGNPVAGSNAPKTAGNGSLMRLAPVAIRFWNDRDRLTDVAARQSRATHAAPEAVEACVAYALMLADLIAGQPLEKVLPSPNFQAESGIGQILAGSWRGKRRGEVRASGYVAHSLEAALWSVGRSGDFRQSVLTAANLAEDADTTAAIAGQLAGAAYGAGCGIAAVMAWR
ncbi:MAG TPA: ADP-ribosylglycohydrolase family protein, partial [Phenylobacterium sp.]|nr:ADP-ribosylglycohydrolase family protein [Phenylobacterium sp.]